MGAQRATGYFVYDWGLKDGSAARFECADVFEFDDNGRIERMIIIYGYPSDRQYGRRQICVAGLARVKRHTATAGISAGESE